MSLEDINKNLRLQLQYKIENEIRELIEPSINSMAKELASNVHTMIIYENHFMQDTLKVDISENKVVEKLNEEIKRLKSTLAQNGIR